jgi:hypothetical protein
VFPALLSQDTGDAGLVSGDPLPPR